MDDWTFAYILVGILIPLAFIASASYGIYKQRRAAAHAVALQKRQEGLYETYWYSWKQDTNKDTDKDTNASQSATNDNGIRGLFDTRELADMSQRKTERKKERKAHQIPAHPPMTVQDTGEGSSRELTHDSAQTDGHNSIYWTAV